MIKNVGEWKAIVNAIGAIVEDAMFICNSDGITFRGMDASHVSLLDITFPKSSFEFNGFDQRSRTQDVKPNTSQLMKNSPSSKVSGKISIAHLLCLTMHEGGSGTEAKVDCLYIMLLWQ